MAFEFRPAVRDKTSVLIALAGASGSGKTLTAILMAFGLAYPGMTPDQIIATIASEGRSRVCFIDTEGGRGRHYAPGPGMRPDFQATFPFEYGEIKAPYTPEVYQEALVSADQAGFAVVIVDSMSHEYESEGGIQEIADQLERGVLKPGKTLEDAADRQDGWKCWASKPMKSPGNWKEPKTRHKKMVNRAVQLRAHVIFCLRAEEKMLLENRPELDFNGDPKMRNGQPVTKMVVVPAADRPLLERWAPICEKRFMYEMTVSFLLLPSAPGVGHPIKNLQDQFKPMFPEGHRLGVRNGEALAQWSTGATARPPIDVSTASGWTEQYELDVADASDLEELTMVQARGAKAIAKLKEPHPELHQRVLDANAAAFSRLTSAAPAGDDVGDDLDRQVDEMMDADQ